MSWEAAMPKRKMTEAERAEWAAERERMRVNAQRTRRLAEKAQAKLDAKRSGLIEVWLDPEDVRWLAERLDCSSYTPDEQNDRCLRIRSRANAALQTASLN